MSKRIEGDQRHSVASVSESSWRAMSRPGSSRFGIPYRRSRTNPVPSESVWMLRNSERDTEGCSRWTTLDPSRWYRERARRVMWRCRWHVFESEDWTRWRSSDDTFQEGEVEERTVVADRRDPELIHSRHESNREWTTYSLISTNRSERVTVPATTRDSPIRRWRKSRKRDRRGVDGSVHSAREEEDDGSDFSPRRNSSENDTSGRRSVRQTWSGTSGSMNCSISRVQCLFTYLRRRTPANCRILISRVPSILISVKASVYWSSNSIACNWVWPFSINCWSGVMIIVKVCSIIARKSVGDSISRWNPI